jgi:protein-tyrosine phosphatase
MSRHIPLEGNFNLRDLGGYATADGHTVKFGCLFRSDELHALTDADLAVIADLGVRVVFDLRNDNERQLRPNRELPDVELHLRETPPNDAGTGTHTFEQQIELGLLPVPDDEEFGQVYVALLTYLAPELRRVAQLALDAVDRPLLFHCAAGKDRTGLATAMLLGILGVSDDTILDDYELTTKYFTPKRFAVLGDLIARSPHEPDHIRTHLSARRRVMEIALTHLHATWGDFDTYAIETLGVEKEVPGRLRAALLSA